MIGAILALILLLVSHGAAKAAEPTEYQKVEALKLGYLLNGNSMVRWGSIDLTDPLTLSQPSSVAPIKVLPTKPEKTK
jgi:hypothetical protein